MRTRSSTRPFGPRVGRNRLTDRIRQRSDRRHGSGDPFKPVGVEPQPVEHRRGKSRRLAGSHVPVVGGKDRGGVGPQGLGRCRESTCALVGRHSRQRGLRLPAGAGHAFDQISRVGLVLVGRHAGPSNTARRAGASRESRGASNSLNACLFPPSEENFTVWERFVPRLQRLAPCINELIRPTGPRLLAALPG